MSPLLFSWETFIYRLKYRDNKGWSHYAGVLYMCRVQTPAVLCNRMTVLSYTCQDGGVHLNQWGFSLSERRLFFWSVNWQKADENFQEVDLNCNLMEWKELSCWETTTGQWPPTWPIGNGPMARGWKVSFARTFGVRFDNCGQLSNGWPNPPTGASHFVRNRVKKFK